jgi:hypothetical protein
VDTRQYVFRLWLFGLNVALVRIAIQPQVLRTYMLDLRKVLGDDPACPRFIQTLPKRGYCFVAQVADTGAPESGAGSKSEARPAVFDGVVGREQELIRLKTLARALAYGQRQTVFVTGATGIGKTALVEAACRQMSAMLSATVAAGQCVEGLSKREDYYAVMEVLRQLCASAVRETATRVLASIAPAWLAAIGRDPGSTIVDARSMQPKAPGDLCRALEELAKEKALVLVFEDLQWANDSTLDLISALARRRTPAKLMVLATYSSHCTSAEHPLKALKQDLVLKFDVSGQTHLLRSVQIGPRTTSVLDRNASNSEYRSAELAAHHRQ